MVYLHEIFSNWKDFRTVKHLRGACFLAARLCRINKQTKWHDKFYNYACKLCKIKKMNKEAINVQLMCICLDIENDTGQPKIDIYA